MASDVVNVLNYSVKFRTAHTPQTPTNCAVMTDL